MSSLIVPSIKGGGGASSSSPWKRIVTEDGSSFANWQSASGTWASNGTVIQQTNATVNTLFHANLVVPSSYPPIMIAQVEFLIPSAGALAPALGQRLSFRIGPTGGADNATGDKAVVAEATNNVASLAAIWQEDVTRFISIPYVWTYFDTWHTLTYYWTGGLSPDAYCLMDGLVIGNATSVGVNPGNNYLLGLGTRNIKANFRNLHVWALDTTTLP